MLRQWLYFVYCCFSFFCQLCTFCHYYFLLWRASLLQCSQNIQLLGRLVLTMIEFKWTISVTFPIPKSWRLILLFAFGCFSSLLLSNNKCITSSTYCDKFRNRCFCVTTFGIVISSQQLITIPKCSVIFWVSHYRIQVNLLLHSQYYSRSYSPVHCLFKKNTAWNLSLKQIPKPVRFEKTNK